MPRKQNGFGSSKSLGFKGAGRVDRGKGVGAFGIYPSDRQYGTSVHRTPIEGWNLNSNWTKWRRGYELWNKAAYSRLNVPNPDYDPGLPKDDTNPQYVPALLKSLLYQGTEYEIETLFTAIEMPTMKSDNNTHYVVKRFVSQDSDLGVITERVYDELEEQRKYNEVWFKGTPNSRRSRLLVQMLDERLTDDETEASLKNVLTKSTNLDLDIPAIYKGKTPTTFGIQQTGLDETTVTVRLPIDNITITPRSKETKLVNQSLSTYSVPASDPDILDNPNKLIGKIVYIQNFYVEKPISELSNPVWFDYNYYFGLTASNTEKNQEIIVLDPGVSVLPPSMYDIQTLPSVLKASNGTYTVEGSYVFRKNDYQRFFKRNYLTADLVKSEVEAFSYSIFPYTILGAAIEGDELVLTSVPFTSEIKLYTQINEGTLVFNDRSFVRYQEPRNPVFRRAINTNVDPHQDQVFTNGNPIKPAEVYSCDCPSYSKTIISMPQSTQNNETRKTNRQYSYPLPTALSSNRFQNLGIDKVAGRAASWASSADKNSYQTCKHTVTGMFVDGVQLIEPSQYPTLLEREYFEDKLITELNSLDDAWRLSAERGGISLAEIVFSLSQGLNLDDVETGYVVLKSNG